MLSETRLKLRFCLTWQQKQDIHWNHHQQKWEPGQFEHCNTDHYTSICSSAVWKREKEQVPKWNTYFFSSQRVLWWGSGWVHILLVLATFPADRVQSAHSQWWQLIIKHGNPYPPSVLHSHDLCSLEKAPDRVPCRYCVDVRPAVLCCKPGDHHRINVSMWWWAVCMAHQQYNVQQDWLDW